MTPSIHIAPGALVADNLGRSCVVTHVLDLETLLAKDQETHETKRLLIKDLTAPAVQGQTEKAPVTDTELVHVPDKEWEEAERRFNIIRPLLVSPRRTKKQVGEAAQAAGVHTVTLYRWIGIYEQTERLSTLLPVKRNGGRGKSRLEAAVEKILSTTIERFYKTDQKHSIEKTYKEIERLCKNAKLKPPHRNTVRNRISDIPEKQKTARKIGAKAARHKFAPIISHFPGADWPLSVVQIDHTQLDIILVDDVYRKSVGRPWIALAIDVFSRMVVGFYISFDPPDAMSVGLCIAHAILPKEKWLAKYDITIPWPCWGVPKTIHADNAKVFRGKMLQRACSEHGIDLEWRPVATPHWGGHIERLLGTLLKEIHELPGTTFSNPKERGKYNSDKKAAMTLSEFEKWFATYIVGIYHQRIHSSLKMSPVKKYEQGIFGTKQKPGTGLPSRLIDEDRLRLDFMPYFERTIQAYGVLIDEIHYYHDVLRRFVHARDLDNPKLKRQFIFKRDPRNIGLLYFFDPEIKQYYKIPYRDTSRPPMSIWDLREVRRQLEKEGHSTVNEQLIFDTYNRLRRQEQQSIGKTKSARRKMQRRTEHEKAQQPQATQENSTSRKGRARRTRPETIRPFDEMEELN